MLVKGLNYSYRHGELSASQKQAVIVLVEKKDRDRRQIKNWRPISLINVDVKIGTKAIAKRMEKVLPQIIHHNQTRNFALHSLSPLRCINGYWRHIPGGGGGGGGGVTLQWTIIPSRGE